jgi:GT2 family glycosyltransferase
MTPLVSIIIPHLNRLTLLQACLGSLEQQKFRDLEVIVVDNGSSDGSLEWLRSQKGLRLLEMGQNRGFTGANLAGLAVAQGSLIAALNNDTEAEADWLEQAVAAMQRDPLIGTVASCLVEHARPGIVDSAGDGLNRAGRGVKLGVGEARSLHGQSRYVFGASAAAALYRRQMLDAIGFFDDNFYFNCEDVDLCARAQVTGWRCWYEAGAVVRHHVSASHAELGRDAIFYWSRNCELLWFKNVPLVLWPLLLPPKLLQEGLSLLRNAFVGPHTLSYLRGKWAALGMLPALWPERRRIQGMRKISLGDFYGMLIPSFDLPSVRARFQRFYTAFR